MVSKKAILVPVDFTEASRHAIVNAIELGRKLTATVYLVNFIPPFTKRTTSKTGTVKRKSDELVSYINLLKENEHKLGEMVRAVHDPDVEIHSEIKIDRLGPGIKKQIKAKNVGLIVIGIADAHTIGDFFCKSKPAQAMIDVDCPIMICNNRDYKINGHNNIVVSLDFNSPDQQNIERLAYLTRNLSLKVYYFHVNHSSDEKRFNRDDIAFYLNKHKLRADSIEIIESNNKEEAIKKYADDKKAGFIAINKFNKSYSCKECDAEQVVQETENPVFMY